MKNTFLVIGPVIVPPAKGRKAPPPDAVSEIFDPVIENVTLALSVKFGLDTGDPLIETELPAGVAVSCVVPSAKLIPKQ
jgi:hypothetical protein